MQTSQFIRRSALISLAYCNLWLSLLMLLCITLAPTARAQEDPPTSTTALPYQAYLPLIVNDEDPAVLAETLVLDPAEAPFITWHIADQISASSVTSSLVATTEDYKALGYPDSRKIVRDSQGGLYVAYRKKLGSNYRIFVAKSTNGGESWSVLNNGQPIETVGDYTQRVPSIAIDNQNRLYLVWYGNDSANSGEQREIKFIRSAPFGASWEPWRALADLPNYDNQSLWQEHPAIYVNGSNVYVVWAGHDVNYSNKVQIKFIRSINNGDTWTNWINVKPSTKIGSSRPTLIVSYVGSTRYLYLFAYRTSNGKAQIYWSRSTNNGDSWSSWAKVAGSTADQRHLAVARDSQEKLHLVWRQVSNGRTIIRYRAYDPAANGGNGAWGTAMTAAAIQDMCLLFPTITVSGNNTVWVAWNQVVWNRTDLAECASVFASGDDPTTGQIGYTSKAPNGAWAAPLKFTTTGDHLYPSLRRANSPTATSGQIDLVWLDITGRTLVTGNDGKVEVTCPMGGCRIQWATLGNW